MKKIFTLLCFTLFFLGEISAQSVTLNVIQPECNNDGILEATVSGITTPYDIVLYQFIVDPSYSVAAQSNVTSISTQFNNLFGSGMWSPGNRPYIAQITQGTATVATSSTFTLPTVINVSTPWMASLTYTCPAAGASGTLSISGGVAPYNILWQNINGSILNTSNPYSLPAGDYNYTVTDVNGCQFKTDG